jgi:proteasome lid subunit RPN8/RPN11
MSEEAPGESQSAVIWKERDEAFRPAVRPLERFIDGVELDRPLRRPWPPLVFVRREAYERLLRDAGADTRREHGGILLGQVFEDPGGRYYLIVESAVLAADTLGSPVHLQFSHESWQTVWERMDGRDDLAIVGWFHTHPGLGVFLSGTDRRTQALYFSQPWQLAVVLDPENNEIGFFCGPDGIRVEDVRTFGEGKPAARPRDLLVTLDS